MNRWRPPNAELTRDPTNKMRGRNRRIPMSASQLQATLDVSAPRCPCGLLACLRETPNASGRLNLRSEKASLAHSAHFPLRALLPADCTGLDILPIKISETIPHHTLEFLQDMCSIGTATLLQENLKNGNPILVLGRLLASWATRDAAEATVGKGRSCARSRVDSGNATQDGVRGGILERSCLGLQPCEDFIIDPDHRHHPTLPVIVSHYNRL